MDMRSGFEKPGFENEIAPERKLSEAVAEQQRKNRTLIEQAHAMVKPMREAEHVLAAIEEALEKSDLSAEERTELERLLERHDEQLARMQQEFDAISREIDAMEDTIAEVSALRTSFTSRGGQA